MAEQFRSFRDGMAAARRKQEQAALPDDEPEPARAAERGERTSPSQESMAHPSFLSRAGKIGLHLLLGKLFLPGTNLMGMVLFMGIGFAAFESHSRLEASLGKYADSVSTLIMGVLSLCVDVGLRKAMRHETLFTYDKGARFVFAPLWIWGMLWCFVAAVKGVLAL